MLQSDSVLDHVPPLVAKGPGPAVRLGAVFSKSIRAVTDTIVPFTQWWSDQNQVALADPGPLLLTIGDSTAIGIGASHPANGYIGRLIAALNHSSAPLGDQRDGAARGDSEQSKPWRVINLGQSGATFDDGLERQVPTARQLPPPDLVVCCLGTNDVVWGLNTSSLRTKAKMLVTEVAALGRPELGDKAIIACPVAGRSSRVRMVNRAIRAQTEDAGIAYVNPWNEPGPESLERLASDRFHPNDLGYALMAKPIGRHLGVERDHGIDDPGAGESLG